MQAFIEHLPLIDKRSGELCKQTEVPKVSQQTFALVSKTKQTLKHQQGRCEALITAFKNTQIDTVSQLLY